MDIGLNDYDIIKLEKDRLKDLAYIFEAAFGNRPSDEELEKRHMFCHGDTKFTGFIAYHKATGEPAAYYGVFPVFIEFQGQSTLAAQSGDTMTHPNHQKKGLFVKLARVTFQYCTAKGITLIFGFPNQNSYPGFMKHLGFTELPRLKHISVLENKFEITRFSVKNARRSDLHRWYLKLIITMLSGAGSSFQNSNALNLPATAYTLHDDDFFKLKNKPGMFLRKICGIDVWISVSENHLLIGDIDLKTPAKLPQIIRRLKLILRISGYRFLSIDGTENAYLISLFKGLQYNATDSFRLIFLNLSSTIPFEKFSFLNCDIDVF